MEFGSALCPPLLLGWGQYEYRSEIPGEIILRGFCKGKENLRGKSRGRPLAGHSDRPFQERLDSSCYTRAGGGRGEAGDFLPYFPRRSKGQDNDDKGISSGYPGIQATEGRDVTLDCWASVAGVSAETSGPQPS